MDKCALFVFLARQEKTEEARFFTLLSFNGEDEKEDFMFFSCHWRQEKNERSEVFYVTFLQQRRKVTKGAPLKGKRRCESRLSG